MRLVKDNVVKIKTDETAIKRLLEAGYVSDDVKPEEETKVSNPDYSSMTYSELQEAAKANGLKYAGVKKAELLKALEGGQAE